jgi:ligand-binding sensor domain-containing protein/signal transduction histidine kinase
MARGSLLAATVIAVLAFGPALGVRLPVREYSTKDGLPRDGVNALAADSVGHLWIGTDAGLTRFDGQSLVTFGEDDGLVGAVTFILPLAPGGLLVGTNAGLARLRPTDGRFTRVPYAAGAGPRVSAIAADSAGRLWVGSPNGLHPLVETSGDLRLETALPDIASGVDDIAADARGDLWIAAHDGLARVDPVTRRATGRYHNGVLGERPQAALVDRAGRVWVGTRNGLCRLNLDASPDDANPCAAVYKGPASLPTDWVFDLMESPDGAIYAGCGRGISIGRRDQQGEFVFRPYADAEAVPGGAVFSIARDRDGNTWLGTQDGGALKIVSGGFVTFGPPDGIERAGIYSLLEDRRGSLLATSLLQSAWSIQEFDGTRFHASRPKIPGRISYLGWGSSQVAFPDSQGRWWVPTGAGACVYRAGLRVDQLATFDPERILTTKDGLVGNEIFRLFEDSRGDVWIGTIGGGGSGIAVWRRRRDRIEPLAAPAAAPEQPPTFFAEDSRGVVWAGLFHGGLARFAEDGPEWMINIESLPRAEVNWLSFDRRGRLWVATGAGLACAEDPTARPLQFKVYTHRDGLSADEVFSIAEDGSGRLWLGTAAGVTRFDPDTPQVRRYSTSDGLPRSQVTSILVDRGGQVWAGTREGLARMDPGSDPAAENLPVFLEALEVAGVPQAVPPLGSREVAGLRIPRGRNRLRVDFRSASFRAGESVRFQYRLDNREEFTTPAAQRSVVLDGLPPGHHVFEVRAVALDGSTSREPASVEFFIAPPLWQTWWFLAAVTVAVGTALVAWHRLRVERAVALERVRTHIATDLHDDVGSSLTQIALLNEVALSRVRSGEAGAVPFLEAAAHSAREVVDTMSDVVWAVDPRRDRLDDLAMRMRRFAEEGCAARGLSLQFAAPADGERRMDSALRRQIFLVFKESVNNALKHSGCRAIDVRLEIDGGRIQLRVADDGCGFDPNAPHEGHGLASLRRRSREVGGTLLIESGTSGAEVRFEAPL